MTQATAIRDATLEEHLASLSAVERVEWALAQLPGNAMLSSSFGAQAAVMLHLVTRIAPDLPVVMIDTGYLFPETYRFADMLTARLDLNLRVYRPATSAAWQEARYGKRWEQGLEGIERYNRENKVEPMERALAELDASVWFSGLRRVQSKSRANTPFVREDDAGRLRVHPIADFSDRDVHDYLVTHDLPYHPLWEKGYLSIGDTHSTKSLSEVQSEDELRFFGLTRECGLHPGAAGKTA